MSEPLRLPDLGGIGDFREWDLRRETIQETALAELQRRAEERRLHKEESIGRLVIAGA